MICEGCQDVVTVGLTTEVGGIYLCTRCEKIVARKSANRMRAGRPGTRHSQRKLAKSSSLVAADLGDSVVRDSGTRR
jgi:uncharacterized protein YlaI